MTDERQALFELIEKRADTDFVHELLQVENRCGPGICQVVQSWFDTSPFYGVSRDERQTPRMLRGRASRRANSRISGLPRHDRRSASARGLARSDPYARKQLP